MVNRIKNAHITALLMAGLMLFGFSLSALALFASHISAYESDADFQASQGLRQQAVAYYRGGDIAAALSAMQEAYVLRPGNPALLSNLIALSVEKGDAALAGMYAHAYADLGLVPAAGVRQALSPLLPAEEMQHLNHRFDENRAPLGKAQVLATVPDDHHLVEGLAIGRGGDIYVSTVVQGTILKKSKDGSFIPFVERANHTFGSFFGIAFHARENALFAAYGYVPQTATDTPAQTGVTKFDADTGTLLASWSLAGAGEAGQVSDLLITKDGRVFAIDTRQNLLLALTENGLEDLKLEGTFMSLQGAVEAPDGSLLISDYGRGLWHYNPVTKGLSLLDPPEGTTLIGMDGLIMHDERLFAVQNGVTPHRIIEIKLNTDQSAIEAIHTVARALPVFDEPTLEVSIPGKGIALVAASQWPKFGEGGSMRDGETIAPTPIVLIMP